VIAQAGDIKITDAEFEKSYKMAIQNSMALDRPPTKKEHLEDMIRYRIGLAEARQNNLDKHPIVKKALDLELYKGLIELNLAKDVEKIKVTDSEMKSYYAQNPEMRSSHILISYPIGASEKQIQEAKSRANKIYKDVITGTKKWSVYVRTYSDDNSTKALEGDVGYQSSRTIQPRYYNALKKLKMGAISPPVQSIYGFHIIKKTGQRSYERANKDALKIAVFDKKRFEIFDKYFEKLKRKYKVSIDPNFI
jgi:peptidyl-prolyl cis-trans isomerase C/peptidyl-prolyl cis-trans isomerase D